jgi:hypothetical protein
MEMFLIWVILSIVIGVGAGSRGRSGVGWFFLSLITSPLIAGILLALMPSLAQVQSAASSPAAPLSAEADDLRKCPECAELIKREARKCKHCGSQVEPLQPATTVSAAPAQGYDGAIAPRYWDCKSCRTVNAGGAPRCRTCGEYAPSPDIVS